MKWWDLFVVTVVTGRRQFLGISVLSLLSLIILGLLFVTELLPSLPLPTERAILHDVAKGGKNYCLHRTLTDKIITGV